jgi:hypothetical protein
MRERGRERVMKEKSQAALAVLLQRFKKVSFSLSEPGTLKGVESIFRIRKFDFRRKLIDGCSSLSSGTHLALDTILNGTNQEKVETQN